MTDPQTTVGTAVIALCMVAIALTIVETIFAADNRKENNDA